MDENLRLPVFYGWAKINKIQKREALSVIFLNDVPGPRQCRDGFEGVSRWIEPVYMRKQTIAEMSEIKFVNRMYTSYNLFFDDPRFAGSLEKILEYNFIADKNHVSLNERKKIKEKLKTSYIANHPFYKEPKQIIQLSLW